MGAFTRLQKDSDLSQQHMAAGKSSLTGLHELFAVIIARAREVELANEMVRMVPEILSSMHAERETGLTMDFGNVRCKEG